MTSTTPLNVPRSVELAARVTTLLARTFPEYVPGAQAGFRVESLDHQEPRRMFVRWYGGERTRPVVVSGPKLGVEGDYADVATVLTRAGFAVTKSPGRLERFVADRPADVSGPRYAVVAGDVPFLAAWVVLDRWTRVPAAAVTTQEIAVGEAHEFERDHVLEEARAATDSVLWPFLTKADALLGDGVHWLHQEVHDSRGYGDIVERERLEAVLDVANALRRGDDVALEGRRAAYSMAYPLRAHWPLTYQVRWVPKATAPAVGFFPHPDWQRGPDVDAAITALADAGLRPVVYGESLGSNGFMCEQDGFMVSAADPADLSVPGVDISVIGLSAEIDRVPQVLGAAGWRVLPERDALCGWTAYPPTTA
ncbi:hypothetical protein ABT024_05215 [Streptomyces sp. NPDC002812]|uniref:hypothetical protein n=1 Tax=Streptomyces sp. NPDC002812 TaxID=3154434 RepID=UPI00331C65B6